MTTWTEALDAIERGADGWSAPTDLGPLPHELRPPAEALLARNQRRIEDLEHRLDELGRRIAAEHERRARPVDADASARPAFFVDQRA